MIRVIAIDGPSGTGKSSVASDLAQRLGWTYLDTGAMYRAVTHAWLTAGGDTQQLRDSAWLATLHLDFEHGNTMLNGENVNCAIRSETVTQQVSDVSAEPAVRQFLTQQQRELGRIKPCVLEGRDIGTVVFPDAFFKVFLTASAAVRAERRWRQLGGEGTGLELAAIQADLERRDQRDSSRDVAPLRQADDAYLLDTDHLSQAQVVETLYAEAQHRLVGG